MTAKKMFDRPDLLVIEGYATLLENDQVLLFNSKMFVITVTCRRCDAGTVDYWAAAERQDMVMVEFSGENTLGTHQIASE